LQKSKIYQNISGEIYKTDITSYMEAHVRVAIRSDTYRSSV